MKDKNDCNKAWRIDTLDPRGGLAFASFRAPDLVGAVSADGPAAFIGAPDFRPESISSRAVGLAAARGAFQIGLFIDEAEVGFETLADLIEFVRRCYLRGAGGDGTDGGGGGLPPAPEGPPPDIPEEPDLPAENPDGGVSALFGEIKQFEQLSNQITYRTGQSAETVLSPWNPKISASSSAATKIATDGVEVLLRAAVTMIFEMLRRYPVTGSDDDILRWHSSAQSLGWAFWRLGLWPFLLEFPYAPALSRSIDAIGRLSEQVREQNLVELWRNVKSVSPIEPLIILLSFFFGSYWLFEGGQPFVELFYRYPDWITRRLQSLKWAVVTSQTDPIDDLSRWPIPKQLSHFTGQRNIDTANVLGLMSTIQASPSVIASAYPRKAISALEIALLGAAHLVRETEPEVLLGNGFPGRPNPLGPSPIRIPQVPVKPAKLHELRLTGISKGACDWFIEQMPQTVFPQRLEGVIQETAERSYND